MNQRGRLTQVALTSAVLALLGACGSSTDDSLSSSSGQVRTVTATKMSAYAGARIADQVSFGATPSLVTELTQAGLSAWIETQMALPASRIVTPPWVIDHNRDDPITADMVYSFVPQRMYELALTAPDQLRLRVSWALLQFVPVNLKVDRFGMAEHFNLLQRHAFGDYGSFLRELSIHPAMGRFLDNNENRPLSSQCTNCSPNENYARELMQLFSLGVVKLNPDGSPIRDAKGRLVETYSQNDVEELARALTGWRFAPSVEPLPDTNWINAGQLMVPEESPALHDRGSKSVLGTAFAAGRDASSELDTVVEMLMAHPNIAPFVSLRLIQHLVTSNPTPQYLGRVAAVFRNNGQGVAGDMKAVIRAVLLDAEARQGDVPGVDTARIGKLREPVLFYTASLRGLGCSRPLNNPDGSWFRLPGQTPFEAQSVFSYYLPSDRAPASNLLAPEQKLLITDELTQRLSRLSWTLVGDGAKSNTQSGCDVATLGKAFAQSPKTFVDLVSARWFRGAMPPTLRSNLLALAVSQTWNTPDEGAFKLMQYALTTPYFGVIK